MTGSEDWFARYKFLQPLGQGGMGTVYLAEDKRNGNSNCVIKQLINKHSDPGERAEAVRLFKREVAILRSLNHPGIVRVFDEHTAGDKYFLVMDYVPGKNLEAILNGTGPLTSELAVRIAIQVCDVLEYLHGGNPPIIYRDLKPSNLMLTPDGRIVFIDFGIARALAPKDVATRVVTAGYSPPEQYFGKPETRSDLYALGATISHLVTGSRPKPLTTCNPILINPHVTPSLDSLVRRLTAHDAEQRPPSAQAVRHLLYMIYKEFHPEFEIPPPPENNGWDEAAEAQEAARLKLARSHPHSARQPSQASSQQSPQTQHSAQNKRAGNSLKEPPARAVQDNGRTRAGADMNNLTLAQKVRRWFEMLLSR